MELVLDYQIGRPQWEDVDGSRCWETTARRMPIRFDVLPNPIEVGAPVAVALAPSVDPPEEQAERTLPREERELVGGGDYERGQEAMDLFVDGYDWQAIVWALSGCELAPA
jgi:hypothetical protein